MVGFHLSVPEDVSPIEGSHRNAFSLKVFYPTHSKFDHPTEGEVSWSSRTHRKGRYRLLVPHNGTSRYAASFLHKVAQMRRVEYWNISWWVAVAFTVGSIIWVVNGFAVFLPFCISGFPNSYVVIGWSAFVGATIFEVGGILAVWEALNRDDVVEFGQAVKEMVLAIENGGVLAKTLTTQKWIWWSTETKYWRELGFLAAVIQFFAASIFWISGFTALPQIQSSISKHTALDNGAFWTPQVIGGTGFMISSILIMLEVQTKWYAPKPLLLGWQVGFWNLVGAIGFTLSGALGYAASKDHGAAYQSSLSTFWGSWAFLIGSVLQWFEAVNSVRAPL